MVSDPTVELNLGLEKSGKSQGISCCLESGNPVKSFFNPKKITENKILQCYEGLSGPLHPLLHLFTLADNEQNLEDQFKFETNLFNFPTITVSLERQLVGSSWLSFWRYAIILNVCW